MRGGGGGAELNPSAAVPPLLPLLNGDVSWDTFGVDHGLEPESDGGGGGFGDELRSSTTA